MCDCLSPVVYKVVVVSPNAQSDRLSHLAEAGLLAAFLLGLCMCIGIVWWFGVNGNLKRVYMQRRAAVTLMVSLVVMVNLGLAASAETPVELDVYTPADNLMVSFIEEISKDYCTAFDEQVNITCLGGRGSLLKEVIKEADRVDVVILEEEYSLFNLSGMKTLKEENLIEESRYLYTKKALLVFRSDENVHSLDDLGGWRIAITDQHVPGACLATKVINASGLNVTWVTVSSVERQLDAVIEDLADATIIWDNVLAEFENNSLDDVQVIDVPEYKMDNFIAILKGSENSEEAEMFVDYLLNSMPSYVIASQLPSEVTA